MKQEKEQFNKLIFKHLVTRFHKFVANNGDIFKGRSRDTQAANMVFEAGLDVCEKQAEKSKNKKND